MAKGTTTQVSSSVPFDNDTNGFVSEDAQAAIEEAKDQGTVALNTPRYSVVLQHNGVVSGGTYFGYDSLISGDDTPIVIPLKSELLEFTFSNSRTSADYTLQFRKNSTGATNFYTVSKTNTQIFTDITISETFNQGDTLYLQYQDDGINASDAVIVLYFKAVP